MPKLHIIVFVLSLIFFNRFVAGTDICCFSVGQASFSLIKEKNRAFVIDCGTKMISHANGKRHQEMCKNVQNILGDVNPFIFITHQDIDHYCGLKDFFGYGRRSGVVVGGGYPQKKLRKLNDKDVLFVDTFIGGEVTSADGEHKTTTSEKLINEKIKDSGLKCLLPPKKVGNSSNAQSLFFY